MPATSLAFRSADMLGIGVLEFGKSPFSSFYPRRIGAKDYPSITRGSTDIAEKQLGLKHWHFVRLLLCLCWPWEHLESVMWTK